MNIYSTYICFIYIYIYLNELTINLLIFNFYCMCYNTCTFYTHYVFIIFNNFLYHIFSKFFYIYNLLFILLINSLSFYLSFVFYILFYLFIYLLFPFNSAFWFTLFFPPEEEPKDILGQKIYYCTSIFSAQNRLIMYTCDLFYKYIYTYYI